MDYESGIVIGVCGFLLCVSITLLVLYIIQKASILHKIAAMILLFGCAIITTISIMAANGVRAPFGVALAGGIAYIGSIFLYLVAEQVDANTRARAAMPHTTNKS